MCGIGQLFIYLGLLAVFPYILLIIAWAVDNQTELLF